VNLHHFEQQLKKINPELRVRQRYFGGVAGVFFRNDFLVTISKGDIPLNTMSYIYKRGDRYSEKIRKRGRSDTAMILMKRGFMNRIQSVKLKYGLL